MSNSVSYYEKQFTEARRLLSLIKTEAEAVEFATTRLAGSPDQTDIKKLNSDIAAAAAILKEYCDKFLAHHKDEALMLKHLANALTVNAAALARIIESNALVKNWFYEAIIQSKGFEKLKHTEEQKDEIRKEMKTQSAAITLDFQKDVLACLMVSLLKNMTLAAGKSDFASLCFVIIKRLNLESRVPREFMENIIRGANFSEGFFRCCSSQGRRAEEMANLDKAVVSEQKQSLSLKA